MKMSTPAWCTGMPSILLCFSACVVWWRAKGTQCFVAKLWYPPLQSPAEWEGWEFTLCLVQAFSRMISSSALMTTECQAHMVTWGLFRTNKGRNDMAYNWCKVFIISVLTSVGFYQDDDSVKFAENIGNIKSVQLYGQNLKKSWV